MVPRAKQGGQAALEYILLLVLVVAIAVGLGTKLFQPLKKWTDFYLGSYTTCMLDAGKLPAIAGGDPSDCPTTTISSGAADGAGGSNNSAANQAATSNSGDSTAANAQKQAAASAEARAAAARNRRGGGSSGSRSGGAGSNGSPANIGAETAIDDKVTSSSLYTNQDVRGRRRNYNPKQATRTHVVRGLLDEEKEKLEKREERITRLNAEFGSRRPKQLPFKPPAPRKVATTDDDEIKLGFGGLFRMALIIAIIVAVIYMVGTQLNNISKGSEK